MYPRKPQCNITQIFSDIVSENTAPLPFDSKRVATATLRGYAFQVWIALEQWLRISHNVVLYLEGAEDLDRIHPDRAETIQIRHTASTISLNTQYARDAIKNFWKLQEQEYPRREVHFQYLTTSTIAQESGAPFGEENGITTWSRAKYDTEAANQIRAYLVGNLETTGSLSTFLQNSSVQELQARLFSKFKWVVGHNTYDAIKEVALDSLNKRLSQSTPLPRATLEQVIAQLFAYCWDRICQVELVDRCLTYDALDTQIQNATQVNFSLPIGTIGGVMAAASYLAAQQNISALNLLVAELPPTPYPLLERKEFVGEIHAQLLTRTPVLLTGSVFKGKTTLAILAARRLCPEAWWVELAERPATQIREILTLLYQSIDTPVCPNLIVLDDLNTDGTYRAVYGGALNRFLLKAKLSEKSILITSKGTTVTLENEVIEAWSVYKFDVAAMNEDEISTHCVQFGCVDVKLAGIWGKVIRAQTSGHPKLVQVRIRELLESDWKASVIESLSSTSSALLGAQELARATFRERHTDSEAMFVYTAAEFSVSPTKQMLFALAEEMHTSDMPGDLISRLEGRWLETTSVNRYRVTPILKARRGETWSDKKFRGAHKHIFDAISKSKLTPSDGAALVFHSYVAGDAGRLAISCWNITNLKDQEIKVHALKNLSWTLALSAGKQSIFPSSPMTAIALRHLQFQVADIEKTEDANPLIEGWRHEISLCPDEMQDNLTQMLNYVLLISDVKILPKTVISCALSASSFTDETIKELDGTFNELLNSTFEEEIPKQRSQFQSYIAVKRNLVYDIFSLLDLTDWLLHYPDISKLKEFDAMARWPLIRLSGSFIHTAWANNDAEKVTWETWISALETGFSTCTIRGLPCLGTEFARAISIIQTEYLKDSKCGMAVLELAKTQFGERIELYEQLINCHYHSNSHVDALAAWREIERQFELKDLSDAYTYRRAALAAIGVRDYNLAAQIFKQGAESPVTKLTPIIRTTYIAEAALACAETGEKYGALQLMLQCFEQLPPIQQQIEAAHWQAILRSLTVIAAKIRGFSRVYGRPGESVDIQPGFISAPSLKLNQIDSLQELRQGALEVEILTGLLDFGEWKEELYQRIRAHLVSPHQTLRIMTALNLIRTDLECGISKDYIEHVEVLIDAMETARKDANFGEVQKDWDALRLGYYVAAIIKFDIKIDYFDAVLEEAITINKCLNAQHIYNLFKSATNETLIEANKQIFGDGPYIPRIIYAAILHASPVTNPQTVFVCQALLARIFFLFGAYGMLKDRNADGILNIGFAKKWEQVVKDDRPLKNKMFSAPALVQTIDQIYDEKASITDLLFCASSASGVDIGSLVEEIRSHMA
jgi:hypothetical protein